ncbi:MAG: TonB family protein [Sphingomonas sp.]|uniref:energy transducer TonB n=1 Tax=Sphingomonas sp. TaxID=28214 RepID=UPI001AC93B48|nr:energy transducer TonB [Sphingomonas sp.]MBN8815624.1 TonB family protein [Sphingomonas sp.]
MYANQFAASRGFKPGSMALALATTALPIAGLILSTQAEKIARIIHPPITIVDITPPKDPPPDPKPQPKSNPIDQKVYTPPIATKVDTDNKVITAPTFPETPPPPIPPGTGEVLKPPVTPPAPVIVGAAYDPSYASALQPPYPAAEIRSGNSGRVVLRVLIGADGRVKQVERISAASDAFFAAAEKQALTKWRFKPATSDGTPIEQWKTMSLRFELQDQ